MRIIGNDPSTPRQAQVVASGTLSTGDAVVVNSDGTVSVISETPASQAVGSPTVFESASITKTCVVYDANANKIVIAYSDNGNSNYGTAVVGTVSGSSISFGTPVVFQSTVITANISGAYDSSAQSVVFSHGISGGFFKVIAGSVSGTSVTFGSAATIGSSYGSYTATCYDSSSEKVVVAFQDASSSNQGRSVVATVTGTSVSLGSVVTFESGDTRWISAVFDSGNNKVVFSYSDDSNGAYGTAIVGTVSGTSISFGSAAVYHSALTEDVTSAYDSNTGKTVIAYKNKSGSSYGTAVVGTVSGTSISFGSAVVFQSISSEGFSATFDESTSNVVIAYREGSSGHAYVIAGSVSGTSISFATRLQYNSVGTDSISVAYNSTENKSVIGYRSYSDNYGRGIVYNTAYNATDLTSENYIGTAASGAADTQRAKINLKGAVADIPATYYDIANASYDSVSFSVNAPAPSPRETMFNADGTKMYVLDNGNDSVYQFSLSTGFDLSTASYDSVSFSVTSQASNPQGFSFNNDGTKMYVVGEDNDSVYQYSLSTGFDLSTTSYDSVSFSVASQEATPAAVVFNTDGTKMYICGEISDAVHQYSLSTGFDISTASYDSVSFDFSSQATIVLSMAFNGDGTKMFLSDAATDTIYQYGLSTAFNVSTASYDSVSFDVSSQDGNPHGIVFSAAGDKLYVTGWSSDTVYQYSTSASLTAGQSYYVQTDGTLGTTPADPSVFAGTAVAATKLIVKG